MKVIWITDPHLNFLKTRAELEAFTNINIACNYEDVFGTVKMKPDAVLLGGDIAEATNFDRNLEVLAEPGVPIYFVLGNHDYYNGRFETVNEKAKGIAKIIPNLFWLDEEEVVELTPFVGLVGVGGWADGKAGDWWNSTVRLNDYIVIDDFRFADKANRLKIMQKIAKEGADKIRVRLEKAFEKYEEVFLLTHVPPWRSACVYNGEPSDDNWAPHFANLTLGEVVEDFMKDCYGKLTVLCGHTHGQGECQILPNLKVITGGAKYGAPKINQTFDLI